MDEYLRILRKVWDNSKYKRDRTGTGTYAIAGETFHHDMSSGEFPLLTTKKMPFSLIASELEFFLNGHRSKNWLQERGNHIWDEWCNPRKQPYGTDEESKQKMLEEDDLGRIYGVQWREFGRIEPLADLLTALRKVDWTKYSNQNELREIGERINLFAQDPDFDKVVYGVDQLEKVVEQLKTNPDSRRILVTAWNPLDSDKMALEPCHYGFQLTVLDDKLNLMWNQRSVDTMLGLPFNIASYALLLHLFAQETGYQEGILRGNLGDVHIYDMEDHLDAAQLQLEREPLELPRIETDNFTSIFEWTHTDSRVVGYKSYTPIKMKIAV